MDNERCKITFDNPLGTYYSGQTINGTFSLICNKGKKIRGIYFKISGYGKCNWTTILQRSQATQSPNISADFNSANTKPERSIQFSGNEEYLNSTVYLAGSKNGPTYEIPEGTTTFAFTFQLKHLLPSSFRGSYGKIKYKMEFIVDKPWKFDEKYEVPLNIIKSLDLNFDPHAAVPQQKQITRNIGYFGSGPISLHIFIPRSGCVPSEHLPLQVIVSNNSSTHVDKVKFTLRKVIDYYSITPSRATKQETVKILKKEAGGVDKKSEQRYEHNLEIPELPSTDTNVSAIINVRYEIQVEAKISGLYKNLVETIPLVVATVPLRETTIPTTTAREPHGIVQMPMPMPMPTAGYPSLESYSPNNTDQSYPLEYPSAPNTQSTPYPPPRHNHVHGGTNLPSAPPLDFTFASPNSTRSSICSQHWDTPPTYDEVFGSPAHSIASSQRSAIIDGGSTGEKASTATAVASFS